MADHPIDVARDEVEAFNNGDWDRLRQISTPDCVEYEYGTARRFDGIDAIVEGLAAWRRGFPDSHGTVKGAYADGPVAVLELLWEGTNTGPMATPDGKEMPATGRHASVEACQVVEVEDGKIKSVRHYFDGMTLMQQLGVGAPAQAGVA